MATPSILRNARLFVAGADLTGAMNKVELKAEREDKDVTTFASYDSTTGTVWTECKGGLIKTTIGASGHWEAGDDGKVDDVAWARRGEADPWTVGPHTAAVGALAWVGSMMENSYTFLGAVGDVAPWQADALGSAPLARGAFLHPPGTARSTTGTGTGVQLGAIGATQSAYACLHVVSVSGTTPSITVKLQSDDNSDFTSATDRGTFTAANAISGQTLQVAGAVTDDYWRAAWTISGTTPSFLFVVSAGIA